MAFAAGIQARVILATRRLALGHADGGCQRKIEQWRAENKALDTPWVHSTMRPICWTKTVQNLFRTNPYFGLDEKRDTDWVTSLQN
jgi:hypothetical protein